MEQSGHEDVGKRQHANEIFLPFFLSFSSLSFLSFSLLSIRLARNDTS